MRFPLHAQIWKKEQDNESAGADAHVAVWVADRPVDLGPSCLSA